MARRLTLLIICASITSNYLHACAHRFSHTSYNPNLAIKLVKAPIGPPDA